MTARGAGSPAQKTKARTPAKTRPAATAAQPDQQRIAELEAELDIGQEDRIPSILRFDTSTNGHDTTRIPLFSIDGKVYTIPAHPPMTVGLAVQHISADDSVPFGIAVSRANRHMLTALLGAEGYQDLITCKQITREAFGKIVGICTGVVMGELEDDPKDG